MKRTLLVVSLLMAFSTAAVLGGEKTKAQEKHKAAAAQKKQPQKVQKIAVTGSYIKKPIGPDGFVEEGPSPLRVITGDTIRSSGSADILELLTQKGYRR